MEPGSMGSPRSGYSPHGSFTSRTQAAVNGIAVSIAWLKYPCAHYPAPLRTVYPFFEPHMIVNLDFKISHIKVNQLYTLEYILSYFAAE